MSSKINIDQATHDQMITFQKGQTPTSNMNLPAKNLRETSLIFGASSGVGRALATELASQDHDLILIAREQVDLIANARDCEIRFGSRVWTFEIDLNEAHFSAEFHIERVCSASPRIQNIFICAGANEAKDTGLSDEQTIRKMTEINFLNLALFISQISKQAARIQLKTILVCSSIAAHAPRSKNIAYASAKAALESFCCGLRHFLSSQNIRVQIYVLGYLDTGLSYGQKLLFPAVEPKLVAQKMIKNLNRDVGRVFYPWFWRFIIVALRFLPWAIYKRLKF